MKKKFPLFSVAALMLGFVSCSDFAGSDLNRLPGGADSSYLCLAVSDGSVCLRAGADDPMREIRDVTLAFFLDDRLVHVETPNIVRNETGGIPSVMLTAKLPKDNYKLICIANATPKVLQLLFVGTSIDAVLSAHNLKNADLMNIGSESAVTSMVMCNERGAALITPDMFSDQPSGTSQTTIFLEPVFARYIVYGTPLVQNGRLADKSTGHYFVSCAENTTYLVRRPGKLAGGQSDEPSDGDVPVRNRYAQSPSFEKELSEKDYRYTYQKDGRPYGLMPNQAVQISETLPSVLTNPSFYSREVTIRPQDHKVGAIPYVLIRYKFIPNGVTTEVGDDTWVSFNGYNFSWKSFEDKVANIAANVSSNIPGLDDAVKKVWDRTTKKIEKIPTDKEGIRIYQGGYSYYVVPIRHFGDDLAPKADSYGRYGIVRNNEYRINVKSVSRQGFPFIPDLGSDASLLKLDESLGVAIQIKQAEIRETDVDL